MSRLLPVFALFVAAGCASEHDLKPGSPTPANGVPDIELSTNQLQFGPVPGGDTDYQTVTVSNVGDGILTVSDMEITAGSSTFWVETSPTGFQLAPGEQTDVEIGFSPDNESTNYGSLSIYSDDPDEPESIVDLLGLGEIPELALDPVTYTYPSGCEDTVYVTMTNVGLGDLVVSNLRYTGDAELSLENLGTLPLTLPPGFEAGVTIRYTPTSGNPVSGLLEVQSNDPTGVKTATQAGSPEVGNVVDTFQTVADPPIDIVFAIDKSGSMTGELGPMSNAFDQFIADIGNVTNDWRIGVVSKDSGCFNEGIITPSTPYYQNVFRNAVRGLEPFASHDLTEQLLELTDVALRQTVPGGCNAGFSRSNAVLHIIAVSDEPEQSTQGWQHWVTRFQAAKSDPALLKISAVDDHTNSCGSGSDGYTQATAATGGLELNVCNSNWGAYAQQLGQVSATALRTFHLSAVPDPTTIVLTMNGVSYASGWHYDAGLNAVVVDVPIPGNEVLEISYSAIGC